MILGDDFHGELGYRSSLEREWEWDNSARIEHGAEVKTKAYEKQTPFVSRNEVAVSEHRGTRYHLSRLFKVLDDSRFTP